MKLLSIALFSLLSTAALADNTIIFVTTAPTFTTGLYAGVCATGKDVVMGNTVPVSERISACLTSSAITSSTVLLLKEEVRHVEQDAYNFLAGEDMTLALAEVIANTKAEIPDLQEESDEEIVSILLSL